MLLLALAVTPLAGFAQADSGDDFGTEISIEAVKKIDKKFTVGVEAEMRTRDDVKTVDRWSGGVAVGYKVLPWLKASAGYTFLYDNNERISYYEEGDGKVQKGLRKVGDPKKRAQYWGVRHRFNVSLTGSWKISRMELSLRERWQYTYRPEYTVDQRWSYYDEDWDGEEHTYRGKGKSVLRSRLMGEYKLSGIPATPYLSVEAFNAWNLEKIRFTAGADWKLNKKNTLGLYYRYQRVDDDSDNEPNRHVVGLSYKLRL
ncbi:MAG: DUF2490 domain-containing protein [Prevotella sp.]|nr:DUF2490 domain-containing protein [Prevotella sp.]